MDSESWDEKVEEMSRIIRGEPQHTAIPRGGLTMRIALLSVLFAQLVIPASAVRSQGELLWWIAHATAKVRPGDPVPTKPAHEAVIHAARNEFEAFQIILRSGERMGGVDVALADLTDEQGHTIPADSLQVYFVGTIPVKHPSRENSETGDWPDTLVPRVDSWFHEKRNAFPFSLSPRQNQSVWIEVYVPRDTTAGIYRGTVKVSMSGAALFEVPLRLTVWNFELPSTSSYSTSFGFAARSALKAHLLKYNSDDDLRDISNLYSKAALQHRISCTVRPSSPRRSPWRDLKQQWIGISMTRRWDLSSMALYLGPGTRCRVRATRRSISEAMAPRIPI
jgi:hypothetical protein